MKLWRVDIMCKIDMRNVRQSNVCDRIEESTYAAVVVVGF